MNVNVGYYKSILDKYDHFSKNNELRLRNSSYFWPQEYLIKPIATNSTEAITEIAKWGYRNFGLMAIRTTGLFNTYLANKAKDFWRDPVSTETVLKIGTIIEKISRYIAVREPIRIPFIHDLDQIGISAARHIYIVSKDLNTLLKIPAGIKNYLVSQTIGYKKDAQSTSLINKGWQYVKIGTAKISDLILRLISLVMKALEDFPLAHQVILKAESQLQILRKRVHAYLVGKTIDMIDKGEAKARRAIVAKVSEETFRQVTYFAISTGLKVALGAGVYLLAKRGFAQVSGYEELPDQVIEKGAIALKIIGAALWIRCVTPTLVELHKDYKKDFDPNKSLLSIFQN